MKSTNLYYRILVTIRDVKEYSFRKQFLGLFSLSTNKYDIESAMHIRILVFSIEIVKIHEKKTLS
jgi:hypothetical protein